MKKLLLTGVAFALVAVTSAQAGDVVFTPIDTDKFVIKPSNAAAGVAAKTISVVGTTAGNSLKNNGYVRTINNLFGKKILMPRTQAGPSALPTPNMFPSTQYKSYNRPVMPIIR
jgi:hypothetical protein